MYYILLDNITRLYAAFAHFNLAATSSFAPFGRSGHKIYLSQKLLTDGLTNLKRHLQMFRFLIFLRNVDEYIYYTQELMFPVRIWIQQIFQAFCKSFARTATTENVGLEKSSIFLWKGLKNVRQNRRRILRKDSDHDRLKVKLSAKFKLQKIHASEFSFVK